MSSTQVVFEIDILVDIPKELAPTEEALKEYIQPLMQLGEVNSMHENEYVWRMYMRVQVIENLQLANLDKIVDRLEGGDLHVADIKIKKADLGERNAVV